MGLLGTSYADPLLSSGGLIPTFLLVSDASTQRLSTTFGPSGGPISTYTTYLRTVSGRFNPLKGSEIGTNGRLNGVVSGKFYCNGAPDIVETDRLLFDSLVWDVKLVRNMDLIDGFTTIDIVQVFPSGVGA